MPAARINGADIYYEESGAGPPIILSPGGLQGVAASYQPVIEALSREHRVVVYDRRFGGQSRSPLVVQTWEMVCDDVFGLMDALGMEQAYLQPVIEALSREHRVVVYDRRFGGQSRSPLVVQTWEMVCDDVFGLMDALGMEQAYLGGGSFGAAISLGCAYRRPERVRAIFPSNIAGGVICDAYLAGKLFKSMDLAENRDISAVVDAFDPDDRFSPFSPEIAQTDSGYRQALEAMPTGDFVQVMRDTIYALFGSPYLTLGMTEKALRSIRVPAMVMPGGNDIHPRRLAEKVHRLVPNCRWAEVRPHSEEPEKYTERVLRFLSEVEAGD